jgi:hypothetical protein
MIKSEIRQQETKKKLISKGFSDSKYDKLDLTLIDILLGFRNKYPIIIPSHKLLAKMAKCGTSTIQRHLDGLKEDGSLTWHQRWRNNCFPVPNLSNLYILSPIFNDLEFQRKTFHLFKNIRLNVAALFLSLSSLNQENDRRYIKEDIYIKKETTHYSKIYSKSGTGIFHAAKITRLKPPDLIQEENMKYNKQTGPPLPIVKAQSPVAQKQELHKRESKAPVFRRYSQYQLQLLIDAAKAGVVISQNILDDEGIQWRGDGVVREEIKKEIPRPAIVVQSEESSIKEVPYTNQDEFGEAIWEEI